MTKINLPMFLLLFAVSSAHAAADGLGEYYVVSGTLNVRSAPAKDGKITNKLYKRQKVEVFELNGDWARISNYDGSTEGVPGSVGRWVSLKYLSPTRPPEEEVSVANSPVAKAINSSDDFSKHRKIFVSASERLINQGKCTLADFEKQGGWWRSTKHKQKQVYFMYCGGMRWGNRIYLDAQVGNTFR